MEQLSLFRYSGDTLPFKVDLNKDLYGGKLYFSMKETTEDLICIAKVVEMKEFSNVGSMIITHEDTKNLVGNFSFDIRFKDKDGNVETCASGELTLEAPVTKEL